MKSILLAVTLLFATTASVFGAAPQLVADAPSFSFGLVSQGQRVDHTFTFRNAGDAPLNIAKVRSSCGCTAALLSAKVIPPGESGEVKASFDSTRFRGQVAKTIYLYSNDPKNPEVHFTLRGQVQEQLAASPRRIILRDLAPGTPREVSVNVANHGSLELELAPIATSSPELTAEAERTELKPGQVVPVHITIAPRAETGRFSGYVFVRTVAGKAPELRIPVQAVLKSE